MLARALLAGGVNYVMLTAYGMKMPIDVVEFIDELKCLRLAPPARYDVGRNVNTNSIPVFGLDIGLNDDVFGMFGDLRAEYGSVRLTFEIDDERVDSIAVKIYPRLLHFIKSSHITMDIPGCIGNLIAKFKKIADLVEEMRENTDEICGV